MELIIYEKKIISLAVEFFKIRYTIKTNLKKLK